MKAVFSIVLAMMTVFFAPAVLSSQGPDPLIAPLEPPPVPGAAINAGTKINPGPGSNPDHNGASNYGSGIYESNVHPQPSVSPNGVNNFGTNLNTGFGTYNNHGNNPGSSSDGGW